MLLVWQMDIRERKRVVVSVVEIRVERRGRPWMQGASRSLQALGRAFEVGRRLYLVQSWERHGAGKFGATSLGGSMGGKEVTVVQKSHKPVRFLWGAAIGNSVYGWALIP